MLFLDLLSEFENNDSRIAVKMLFRLRNESTFSISVLYVRYSILLISNKFVIQVYCPENRGKGWGSAVRNFTALEGWEGWVAVQ